MMLGARIPRWLRCLLRLEDDEGGGEQGRNKGDGARSANDVLKHGPAGGHNTQLEELGVPLL